MPKHKSDIVLGEKYRDDQTGIEGIATALIFFQHGCERVDLEWTVTDALGGGGITIKREAFDAPRLTHIESGKKVVVKKTGGPHTTSATLRGRR